MSNPLESGEPCQIIVDELFAMVNTRRKMFRLEPIEKRAMASRCTLRFNLGRQQQVDFSNDKIGIAAVDMPALTTMINEQFGVNFENELTTLCARKKVEAAVTPMVTSHTPEPAPEVVVDKSGFGSRLKRLFGGR